LRVVRIEVVLAVEHGAGGDLAPERQAELDRLLDCPLVRHGKGAGECEAYRAGLGVRRSAEPVRAAAEHLRPGLELDVDLQPDHRFPGGHRIRSGIGSNPISASSAAAILNSTFSENCGPISCNPAGSPSESPQGIESPGSPAMFDGIVSRSVRYIAS